MPADPANLRRPLSARLAARLGLAPDVRQGRLLALLAGLLAGAGHAPFSALWLALPGLALAFRLFSRAGSTREAALRLWFCGFGYFGLSLAWIVQPFLVDPVRHGWMAPFALILMAAGLALFWALAGALARALAPGRTMALAATLAGAELLRSYIFTGFPWALVGHVFIGWAPMQLAALIGPVGLTLLALVIAALAAPLVRLLSRHRALHPGSVRQPVFAALLLAAAFGFGLWRQAQPLPEGPGGVVRLVQPAIEQSLKWDYDLAAGHVQLLYRLTTAPPGPVGPPDLVVWPETAFPYYLEGGSATLQDMRQASGEARLMVGAMRVEERPDTGLRVWNSLAEIGLDGLPLQVYDKHHLVPFGEYVPFAPLLERLGLGTLTGLGGFTPGPGPRLLDAGALGHFLPLICYEAIFPQDILAAPQRPDWLLQVTNDAWFGTLQGPYQHLAQARLRAVETGLPLLRAANTGVSAVIDAHGRVLSQLGLGQRGVVDAHLPGALPPTLYWRSGDLPALLAILLLLAGLTLRRKGRTNSD